MKQGRERHDGLIVQGLILRWPMPDHQEVDDVPEDTHAAA